MWNKKQLPEDLEEDELLNNKKYHTLTIQDGDSTTTALIENPERASKNIEREHVRNCSENYLKTVYSIERTAHATRSTKNYMLYKAIGGALSGVVLAVGLCGTYRGYTLKTQFTLYVLFLSLSLLFDAVGLFSRLVSFKSRFLMSNMGVLIIFGLYASSFKIWIVVGALALLSCVLIRSLNARWLDAESFMMCNQVQKTLTNDSRTIAGREWERVGYKVARATGYQLGYKFDDNILHGLFRTFWVLGYGMGCQCTTKQRNTVAQATAQAEEYKSQFEELKARYNEQSAVISDLQEELELLRQEFVKVNTTLDQERHKVEQITSDRDRSGKIVTSIEENNDKKLSEEQAKKIFEENVRNLLAHNTVDETARILDVKRWKVAEISRAMNKELLTA